METKRKKIKLISASTLTMLFVFSFCSLASNLEPNRPPGLTITDPWANFEF